MSRTTSRALLAAHLRAPSRGALPLALLVCVLSLLVAVTPVALQVLGDATVRGRLDDTAAPVRDIVAEAVGIPQLPGDGDAASGDGAWDAWSADLEELRASASAVLPSVLEAARTVSRTRGEWVLGESDPFVRLAVAFDREYAERIDLVDGRLPHVAGAAQPVEVILSVRSAELTGWPVGEVRTIVGREGPRDVVLTGTFLPRAGTEEYWLHVPSVIDPLIEDRDQVVIEGTAFVDPSLLGLAREFRTAVSTRTWFPLDSAAVDARNAAAVTTALRSFTSRDHAIGQPGGDGVTSLRYRADVAAELERALAQNAATVSIIAMLCAGPVGVALGVLALGCRLVLERRRPHVRLLSARGASTGQLRLLLGAEGLRRGLPAAAVGAAVGIVGGMLTVGSPPPFEALGLAALLGLAPAAVLAVCAPTLAEGRARADLGRRAARGRLVAEGALCALAAVAVTLLFVRGYTARLDPLLAATPLLLALVACLVTLRVYPLPLRAVLARARPRAGLDRFLGAARALREPALGLTPVLALVVGVSVAVSSAVLLSVLHTAVADTARARTGADLRVSGGVRTTAEQIAGLAALDGVAAVARISDAIQTDVEAAGAPHGMPVFLLDSDELRAVQGDGPGMLPPGVSLTSDADGPLPLLASPAAVDELGSGELALAGHPARITAVSRGPVPIGSRVKWIAVDASRVPELAAQRLNRTVLLDLDDGADLAAVRAAIRERLGGGVGIDDAADLAARLEAGPAAQGVQAALVAATGVAALLSALAVVMTTTLAAPARARVSALLRTLGAPRRRQAALVRWEIGPPALAALVTGTVFGAVVPLVIMAAVDLRPFTGSTLAPSYALDPAILAAALGGFVATAGVLTAVASVIARRVDPARALDGAEA